MRFNNIFGMQDFFCNNSLSGIVPQVDKCDIERGELSEYKIFTCCQNVLNGFLNGILTDDGIVVINKSRSVVLRVVTACKSVLEAMFDNSQSLLRNIGENKSVYTSVSSISQIVNMNTPQKKLCFLNEILDNINYNPDFNSQNSVRSHSGKSYGERQRAWMRRVGYRLKEAK